MAITLIDNWKNYTRIPDALFINVITFQGEKFKSNSFDYFSDSFAVGDTIVFAYPLRYWGIRFTVGTPIVADSVTFVWEYYSGGWKTLNVINGDALTKSGVQDVMFTLPYDALIGQIGKSIQVRVRIASVTNPTEGGRQSGDYIQWSEKAYRVTGAGNTFENIYTQEQSDTYTLYSGQPSGSLTPILTMPTLEMNTSSAIQVVIDSSTDIGSGDTVTILGTDKFGNNISETLDVSNGNGVYTTNAWFRTLTDVACYGFTTGNITVRTKRACMIEKTGELTYIMIGHLYIGDGSTTTTLIDSNKNIEFLALSRFYITANASFQLGSEVTINNVKYGVNGGRLVLRNKYQDAMGRYSLMDSFSASFAMYGGSFDFVTYGYETSKISFNSGTVSLEDVILSGGNINSGAAVLLNSKVILNRVTAGNKNNFWCEGTSVDLNITDLIHAGSLYAYHITKYPNGNIISGGRITSIVRQASGDAQALTLKNVIINRSNITWGYKDSYTCHEADRIVWSFDLKVIDKEGTAISGARVKIVDNLGATVADLSTDANGDITQQDLKEATRDEINGVIQDWVEHTPHTITISKEGYQTKTMKLTMNRKREEVVVLEKSVDYIMPFGERLYINLDKTNNQNKIKWLKT